MLAQHRLKGVRGLTHKDSPVCMSAILLILSLLLLCSVSAVVAWLVMSGKLTGTTAPTTAAAVVLSPDPTTTVAPTTLTVAPVVTTTAPPSTLPLTFPNNPGYAVAGFIRTADQRFYVVGSDSNVYSRALTDGDWQQLAASSGVMSVTADPGNNGLIAVSTAGLVVKKWTDTGAWSDDSTVAYPLNTGATMLSVAAGPGVLYGVKPDNLLYKWQTAANNTSQWVSIPGGANFKHITVTSAGVLYAACTDGTVWTSSNQGTLWTQTQWTGAQAFIAHPTSGAKYLVDTAGQIRSCQ